MNAITSTATTNTINKDFFFNFAMFYTMAEMKR